MIYPETPGHQAHSDTSRKAADRLTTANSMEKDIYDLLDNYESGWTGDELTVNLQNRGYPSVQTGTIAARLRGLELKGKAVRSEDTRETRAGRDANVWYSKRLAMIYKVTPAAAPSGHNVQELLQRIAKLELENEQLRRSHK